MSGKSRFVQRRGKKFEKKLNMKSQKKYFLIAAFIIIILFELISLFLPKLNIFNNKTRISLENYAQLAFDKCQNAGYRPGCYDDEIPKVMDDISMEDAFKVTRLVQQKDPNTYAYCHVLGHKLSTKETKKDPSDWKDIITRCPSGMCSNGCIHGAFQERFRTDSLEDEEIEKLKPDLLDVCEPRGNWRPSGLEQATCYHALGHLLMYITSADVKKATEICDYISQKTSKNFVRVCYDGAFMQIFQPLELEDKALIRGKEVKKEQLASFCDSFDKERAGSCWSEGWPLFLDKIKKPAGLVKFCSQSKDINEQHRCFNALFYVLTAQFRFDEVKIIELCSGLPKLRKGQCFANAASRMIETDKNLIDKSFSLCGVAESVGVGDACFSELSFYASYNFNKGSEEYLKVCHSLPEKWQSACLSGNVKIKYN